MFLTWSSLRRRRFWSEEIAGSFLQGSETRVWGRGWWWNLFKRRAMHKRQCKLITNVDFPPWQRKSLDGGELIVGEIKVLQLFQRGEQGAGELVDRVPCKSWQASEPWGDGEHCCYGWHGSFNKIGKSLNVALPSSFFCWWNADSPFPSAAALRRHHRSQSACEGHSSQRYKWQPSGYSAGLLQSVKIYRFDWSEVFINRYEWWLAIHPVYSSQWEV